MAPKIHLKNYIKWISITALAMLFIGIIIVFAGFAAGDFNMAQIFSASNSQSKPVTKTVEDAASKNSFVIDINSGDIVVKESETGEFKITYQATGLVFEDKGGEVSLKTENPMKKWYRAINIAGLDSYITVEMPKSFEGSLNISTDFGKIDFDGSFNLEKADFKSGSGKMFVKGITTNKSITIRTDFGEIKAENLYAGEDISIKTASGKIFSSGIETKDKCLIKSDFGKIELANAKGAELNVECASGEVKLSTVRFDKDMNVKSNFGAVIVDEVFSENIKIRVDSGSIKGTIDGSYSDFAIISDSGITNSNLSNKTEGKYRLEVDTDFGDVQINFTE